MLVLTHEKASDAEIEPYIASRWPGMPVQLLLGRCATLEPSVLKEHAVFFGWRDRFMCKSIFSSCLPPKKAPIPVLIVTQWPSNILWCMLCLSKGRTEQPVGINDLG